MCDYKAYRAFGVEPSSAYREACSRLAKAFIAKGDYERPTKQVGQMRDSAFRGTFVVNGEDGVKRGRSVHEHWDKARHMEEAASVPPLTGHRFLYESNFSAHAVLPLRASHPLS